MGSRWRSKSVLRPMKVVMDADSPEPPPPGYFIYVLLSCYTACSRKPHSHTDRLVDWSHSNIGQTKPMHCILTYSVSIGNRFVVVYVKGHVIFVDTMVS
jgi:hypothetical protein